MSQLLSRLSNAAWEQGNKHPSAAPVLLILSVCPGPKVMEKIAFSLPLQDLLCPCCARPCNQCPDLSRRRPEQSDRLMAPLPGCSVLGLLQCGAGCRQKSCSGDSQGSFWLVFLGRPTSSPENLVLSSPSLLCVRLQPSRQRWDACDLCDKWMSHPGLAPLSATLQSN